MSNILNWPDYRVLQVSELEHDYQVHTEVAEPHILPHCNHSEIVGFVRHNDVIIDTPDMKAHFDPPIKAVGNWHYPESLNNLDRVGREYSFESLQAKILFTEDQKARYQRQQTPDGTMGRMPLYGVAETNTE